MHFRQMWLINLPSPTMASRNEAEHRAHVSLTIDAGRFEKWIWKTDKFLLHLSPWYRINIAEPYIPDKQVNVCWAVTRSWSCTDRQQHRYGTWLRSIYHVVKNTDFQSFHYYLSSHCCSSWIWPISRNVHCNSWRWYV